MCSVLGCRDLTVEAAIIHRQGDILRIECEHSEESWSLQCKNNIWIGSYDKCPKRKLSDHTRHQYSILSRTTCTSCEYGYNSEEEARVVCHVNATAGANGLFLLCLQQATPTANTRLTQVRNESISLMVSNQARSAHSRSVARQRRLSS